MNAYFTLELCKDEQLAFSICLLTIFYFLFISLKECNAAIHKKCIDKIIGRCTGTAANSRDTMVNDKNLENSS